MMTNNENTIAPDWVYRNLERFGDSLISRKIVMKHKENLLREIELNGYECTLTIEDDRQVYDIQSRIPSEANCILRVKRN